MFYSLSDNKNLKLSKQKANAEHVDMSPMKKIVFDNYLNVVEKEKNIVYFISL